MRIVVKDRSGPFTRTSRCGFLIRSRVAFHCSEVTHARSLPRSSLGVCRFVSYWRAFLRRLRGSKQRPSCVPPDIHTTVCSAELPMSARRDKTCICLVHHMTSSLRSDPSSTCHLELLLTPYHRAIFGLPRTLRSLAVDLLAHKSLATVAARLDDLLIISATTSLSPHHFQTSSLSHLGSVFPHSLLPVSYSSQR